MAECTQDSKDCDVGGEYAEADGCDHGEAQDNGHQEGNHGLKSLWFCLLKLATSYGSLNSVGVFWSKVPSLCSGQAKGDR